MKTLLLDYHLEYPDGAAFAYMPGAYAAPGYAERDIAPDNGYGMPRHSSLINMVLPVAMTRASYLAEAANQRGFRFAPADFRFRYRTAYYRLRLTGGGAEVAGIWIPLYMFEGAAIPNPAGGLMPAAFRWPDVYDAGRRNCDRFRRIAARLDAAATAFERDPAECLPDLVVRPAEFPYRGDGNSMSHRYEPGDAAPSPGVSATHSGLFRAMAHLLEYKNGKWRRK